MKGHTSSSQEPTSAVAQWIRAVALQAEGWVFEYQPRQTLVVKTGSDKQTKNSRTTENILTKFHIKHPWEKGIHIYANEGPIPFSKGK